MIELIKVVAAVLSLSFRTANTPDEPFDFEFMFGTESKYGKSMFLSERDNGESYYGYDVGYDFRYVKFDSYKKTSKNIDSQLLSVLYPTDNFSFGLAYSTEKWKEPRLLITTVYKNKYLEVDYSRGVGREIIEVDLRYEIVISKQISIVPLALFKKFNNDNFWQAKIVFEMGVK